MCGRQSKSQKRRNQWWFKYSHFSNVNHFQREKWICSCKLNIISDTKKMENYGCCDKAHSDTNLAMAVALSFSDLIWYFSSARKHFVVYQFYLFNVVLLLCRRISQNTSNAETFLFIVIIWVTFFKCLTLFRWNYFFVCSSLRFVNNQKNFIRTCSKLIINVLRI